jgi:hypothetical protein
MSYRRGHLLSQKLHGPGVWWNLTPIPQTINTLMETRVESQLKEDIKKEGSLHFLEVNVEYDDNQPDPLNKFPKKITMTWGELEKNGTTFKRKTSDSLPFRMTLPSANVSNIVFNINDIGSPQLTTLMDGKNDNFAIDVMHVRNNVIKRRFTDEDDLFDNLKAYYKQEKPKAYKEHYDTYKKALESLFKQNKLQIK